MDTTISAGFSGRPYDLRMRVYTKSVNVAANSAVYHGDRYVYSRSGWGSYEYNCGTVDSWIQGYYLGGCYSLMFDANGPSSGSNDFTGKTINVGSYDTGNVGHNSDGRLTLQIRVRMLGYSVYGSADTLDVNVAADRIPRPPAAPTPFGIDEITTVSFRYRFNGNDDGGSPITSWTAQVATDAGFTQNVQTVGSSGTTTFTGLLPGTTHYVRSWGNNAYWQGAISTVLSQVTLPAVAPGMVVLPNPSGVSARVTFTPPGSASGVTSYNAEYRLAGTTDATSKNTPTAVLTVNGLTPGAVYEWRGVAWFGSYLSPFTEWVTVAQPQPNINAGDYFDGSYTSTDMTYAWTGAANASSSTATAKIPTGWIASPSGGTAVIWSVTAGLFGFHAARATIMTDSTGVGGEFGQSIADPYASDVTEGASYGGSLYVRLSRENRVAAVIVWADSAHTVIGRSVGAASLVPASTDWTRLWVTGEAPEGAEWAAIRVKDVVGTGSSLWRGGDVIGMDGAMISLGDVYAYFDGDTPDTADFTYEWVDGDAPNASTSSRHPVAIVAGPISSVIIDPLCPPPPAPPRPPVIPNPCIEESGLWRRTYRNIPAGEISDHLAVVPTFEVVTRSFDVRQVRIRLYENPNSLPPEQVDTTRWISEQIVSFIPQDTVLTIDGVTQRSWAEVAGGGPVGADHLLYGTAGSPPVWPILSCGISYLISVDLPVEVPAGDSYMNAYLTTRS